MSDMTFGETVKNYKPVKNLPLQVILIIITMDYQTNFATSFPIFFLLLRNIFLGKLSKQQIVASYVCARRMFTKK